MNEILEKVRLSENVYKFIIKSPYIAKSRKAGHFVIIRVDKHGERIPLTIAEADTKKGTITLIAQRVGVSTDKLCAMHVGDYLEDIVGPLGKSTNIENFGTVICAGGGVGIAPMLPIATALKKAGNRVIAILAARTKDLIILEEEMRNVSDEVLIMTDDGTYGRKGLVTDGIKSIIQKENINKCFVIGPAIMMKFACILTKKYNIPTDVSLNTIMVDGTGMCGACRITINGVTKFVCVDGPEFDGHLVNFDEMLKRMKAFCVEEHDARLKENLATNGNERRDTPIIKKEIRKTCDVKSQSITEEKEKSRNAEWRVILRKSMSPRERLSIPRQKADELSPEYRKYQLKEEVNRGFDIEKAQTEAHRCLDCNNPGCVQGCPVGIDIPRFIKHIERKEYLQAALTIKETSALPAVCGRVCPQEKQCESHCIHLKTGGKAVAIGYLERFAADFERLHQKPLLPKSPSANATRIAVVGSGPSGLSFAGEMSRRGYAVTVFEALHEIGGVLKYGIPEFRLPNIIVENEVKNLEQQGVTFIKDCIIGKTFSIDDLKRDGFKGIFVGSGAGLPKFMGIPGENAIGIMSSNEYLTRVNLMDASNQECDTPIPIGKHVVVIGGGNTAMDSVRTAIRLGAKTATIVYRRSEEEMPARTEEVHHAKEEGVRFLTLHNPLSYSTDENGHVIGVNLQKMRLGEPDSSGRRRPEPIPDSIESIETDLVIVSIGVSPNPIISHAIKDIKLGEKGTIEVNDNMQSSIPMIYAGGDIVRGGATVILAMGDGKKAANAMDKKIKSSI
mgnify:CR=1 FL=1